MVLAAGVGRTRDVAVRELDGRVVGQPFAGVAHQAVLAAARWADDVDQRFMADSCRSQAWSKCARRAGAPCTHTNSACGKPPSAFTAIEVGAQADCDSAPVGQPRCARRVGGHQGHGLVRPMPASSGRRSTEGSSAAGE